MRNRNTRVTTPTVIIQQAAAPMPEGQQSGAFIPPELMQLFTQFMQQQSQQPVEGQKESIDVKEAAELLGCSVYKTYELVRKNQLPHYKISSRVLFRRSTLLAWIAEQERSSSVEGCE